MVYKSPIVSVDLLLICSTRKDDAIKLYRALNSDYPASNQLKQTGITQSYPDKTYAVHGIAKIAREKLDEYRNHLKKIKTLGGLMFKSVRVEILKE